jgi:hypothetical protein
MISLIIIMESPEFLASLAYLCDIFGDGTIYPYLVPEISAILVVSVSVSDFDTHKKIYRFRINVNLIYAREKLEKGEVEN